MKMKTKLSTPPLLDWHIAHGGTVMWDDNYPWPLQQGPDYMKEYEAVRTGTGILDLSSLFVYDVIGIDAGRFVQRTFTNQIDGMDIGQIKYGAFVNHKGILIDEGNVFKFGPEHYLVTANGPNLEWQMESYAGDLNAKIRNVTDERVTIGVQGPTTLDVLQPLVNCDLRAIKFFRFLHEGINIAGCEGWIARTGYTGEYGFEISVAPRDAVKVWEALIDRGSVPFGVYAVEILRVEAGFPLIYIDYRLNDMSPWDLSMDHFIKFHPECVGTEALLEYQRKLPRRFKTLKIEGDRLPDFHTGIYYMREPVGLITSPTKSPLCGCISLAIIDTPYAEDGTKVEVTIDGEFIPAEVAPLSIFDPEKKRIRG